jgi:hypothetical protein
MLDPARAADLERVMAHAAARLRGRGVDLAGSETSQQLARLLSAVEEFEEAVERCGGDTMVNTVQSSEPESATFVLPLRNADEPIGTYTERLRRAAAELSAGAPPAPREPQDEE